MPPGQQHPAGRRQRRSEAKRARPRKCQPPYKSRAAPLFQDRQAELEKLCAQYWPAGDAADQVCDGPKSPPLSDPEVLELAYDPQSKFHREFCELYDLKVIPENYGQEGISKNLVYKHKTYESASEADNFLFYILSYFTQDEKQLLSLGKLSALCVDLPFRQEKWNGGYAERTIKNAIARHKGRFYRPETVEEPVTEKSTPPPVPIPEENPCEGFSIEGFPEPFKKYIASLRKISDAPLPMLVASTLGCVSAYASKTYLDYFGRLYPNLYELILGDSGALKSTAMNLGCHYAYEREAEAVKTLRETYAKAAAIQPKENALKAKEEGYQQRAARSKVLPVKTTAEMLIKDMASGYKGVLPLTEFSGWMSSLDASYNKSLRATFTDLYDCPAHYEWKTKKERLEEPVVLSYPFISIVGFSAKEWLIGQVSNTDVLTGFFARYLIFVVNDSDNIPRAFPSGDVPDAAFEILLEKIEKAEGELFLSAEAKIAYEKIYHGIYDIRKSWGGDRALLDPFIKRWCPAVLKVAQLMQLMADPLSKEISAQWVASAAQYVGFAMKSTLFILRSGMLDSEFTRNCTAIVSFLKERGGQAKRLQILASRRLKLNKGSPDSKEYDRVLTFLIETGKVRLLEAKGVALKNQIYVLES